MKSEGEILIVYVISIGVLSEKVFVTIDVEYTTNMIQAIKELQGKSKRVTFVSTFYHSISR